MEPFTIGLMIAAGSAAVSGLAQLYNSEKARGAEKKRLNEIEALFDKIKPPDYNVSIVEPPSAHAEALQMPQFSDPVMAPKWNLDKLQREDLVLLEKFTPEIAPLVYEAEPKLIEKSPDMKEGREAQKTALRRFMSIGEGEESDPIFAQRVQEARDRAQTEAQSRAASIMQDFERRGVGGSGMELASKIGASSQAMERNAQLGLAAEAEAYRNQLNALAQGASLGGQIYSQDEATQARNAAIINAFNQRMSKRHQDWEQMRVDALNAADLRNIQEAQRISDTNVQAGNEAARQERARQDALAKFGYSADVAAQQRQDELAKFGYGAAGQERAYADQKEILAKQWRQANIDRQNELLRQQYADKMAQASGKAGIFAQQSASDIGRARDINAAVQGLANVGTSYGTGMMAQARQDTARQQEQDFQRELLDKYGS